MGDLPDLPPGWRWMTDNLGQYPFYEVWCADRRIDDTESPEDWQVFADEARITHDTILRAAIESAADAAGVVLADGWEPDALLRDGVRAHGWSWERTDDDFITLLRPPGPCPAAYVERLQSGWHLRVESRDVGIYGELSDACAAACNALGIPCPPVPEVPDA